MHDLSALQNRVKKNQRSLASWARQHGIECYRLYERDIPELRYIVDRYGERAVIYDKYDQYNEADAPEPAAATAAVAEALGIAPSEIYFKERRRMPGAAQYEKLAGSNSRIPVNEGKRKYLVNLVDYLDTGLFLDHRPMRDRFQSANAGRLLNLFCYTGSVSVAAALGGAVTTSIDMSNSYIAWAQDNFTLNGLDPSGHTFIREDVLKVLKNPGSMRRSFDTVFLDPPTFSNSKKMAGSFDVQRDHPQLIDQTMQLLARNGVLYFSCNRSKFRLSDPTAKKYNIRDITEETIPRDFRNRHIHVCYEIRERPT
jgi:23S rRNA (cytosine1962-C5)-methyltransferase/23S rRNA (guanine2445-N2)-methyltransferase / 23S rRNA (guanine2069-N7)-methyltransferase